MTSGKNNYITTTTYDFGIHALECERQYIPAKSSCGNIYYRWVPTGMPKLPDRLLNVSFYLYETVEDAEKGEKYGGTGFVVSIPSPSNPSMAYIFGVTNWHVAVRDGFSVMRINNKDGSIDIREHDPSEWVFDQRFDIAVIPILPTAELLIQKVRLDDFISKDDDIGIGEDVFMVGRFVDHDGVARNNPAVRFGNISMMPSSITQATGIKAESFCLDMHSRSGFSGSPVFAYNTDPHQFYYAGGNAPQLTCPHQRDQFLS